MGRKVDGIIAVTSSSSARTYTRQSLRLDNRIINQTTDKNLITNSDLDIINMDALNKIDGGQSEDSSLYNSNSQRANKNTRASSVVKNNRRLVLNKHIRDGNEIQANLSTISQRPRRQVKHKFIKSANVIDTNSMNSNDVSEESTLLLSSLSPNKMRLVPMIHRLPMNASSINRQGMTVVNNPIDCNEFHPDVLRVQKIEAKATHNKLTNTDEVTCSHQIQPSTCSEKTTICNDTFLADEDETVKNSTRESKLSDAIFDDEDDIMIVEEKDALDVPDPFDYVAEEVVIEETFINSENEYEESICISPISNSKNQNWNGEYYTENHDKCESSVFKNDNKEIEQKRTKSTNDGSDNQTEPIYLSDSLSCFDSDSDAQDSEMPRSIERTDVMNGLDSELLKQTDEDDDEEHLNESADDVIIVPENAEAIVFKQLGSENIQCAGTYSNETFLESDSQQSIQADKYKDSENSFKLKYSTSKFYETTDGDDSSGVESCSVRSRRDNIARKNYSCRRTYAKRKVKNESEIQEHKDNSSNESQQIIDIGHLNIEQGLSNITLTNQKAKSIIPVAALDSSTMTNVIDEESHFSLVRANTVRTYERKKSTLPNSTTDVNEYLLKDGEARAENELIDVMKCESDYKPKKRGRPRKKTIQIDNMFANEMSVVGKREFNASTSWNHSPDMNKKHNIIEMQDLNEITNLIQSIQAEKEIEREQFTADNIKVIDTINMKSANSNSPKSITDKIDIDCIESTVTIESKRVCNETPFDTDLDHQKIEQLKHITYSPNDSTNHQLVETATVVNKTASEDSVAAKPIDTEIFEVESISIKIEQIAIDAKPTEDILQEPFKNIKELFSLDTKTDEIIFEMKTKESKVKMDENSLQKDDEQIVDLPQEAIREIGDTSIRRSGRIRTINKSKQRSHGMGVVKAFKGVVKDRKRTPVIIDEDSSNASLDVSNDNILDRYVAQSCSAGELKIRIKTEQELEKERIDRESGLKLFINIADNEYRSERTISKEAKKMTCDCFLTQTEIERSEMGCGDDCLNRMLLIECGPKCIVGDRCTNRRFQKHENSPCNIFKTEKKGYGLIATSYIPAGVFIMEYVGEVLNSKQFEKRANDYSKQMNAHYYFMALSSDCVIDATKKGNISRFINHSCDPNAETQKWTVNGELRIGFFSKKPIMADEEITFDYQFQRYGKEAQKCFCESINCRGWIGGEPDSEDEVESEDDEESDEDITAETIDKDESQLKVAIVPDETTKKKVKIIKPKKSKDAAKKPAKKECVRKNRKVPSDFNMHIKRGEIMVDPDLDKEIDVLTKSGLKNQVQTLQFSRLMVRAKLQKAKLQLLLLLREGELPCRRLFLDYHGLKLMHSWMSDVNSSDRLLSLKFRFEILQTLEKLPITNKTMLQDSKVLLTVQRWSTFNEYVFLKNKPQAEDNIATNEEYSPSDSGSGTPTLNEDTSSPKDEPPANTSVKFESLTVAIPHILEQNSTIKCMGVDLLKSIISTTEKNSKIVEDSEKLPDGELGKLVRDICLLASKLVGTWEQLPESFKIPKKLRIEQMKEHEREADESYKENVEENTTQKPNSTFSSSSGRFSERIAKTTETTDLREKDPRFRRSYNTLSKHQRRQMFEAKVAQEDAERKRTMEHIIHEARCAFFQLDPRTTRDIMVPVSVNPTSGQWYGDKMIKIPTPPSHSHIKPPSIPLPTDINEYIIPPLDLPDLWKYAINEKGQIYYYHTKILLPQWEPPIKLLPLMEEHRFNDIDIKVENIETPPPIMDDEMEHDCDDEDDDVASILSSSTMNDCLLELKSDPILEKYNEDDSSSTDSDDSLVNELAELEAKYIYIKEKTDEYWKVNVKRPQNLNEEIAAMAKSDSINSTSLSVESTRQGTRAKDEENQINLIAKPNTSQSERRKKKCRSLLVQEIRISPLSEEMKRELRRDSRRYKENKAKLRRQKEMFLKRKSELKVSNADTPIRKLKRITEGLPQVSKQNVEDENYGAIDNHSFSVASFPSTRYSGDSFETKRTKAFASLSLGGSSLSSGTSLNTTDTSSKILQTTRNNLPSTSLTQSIVNKLPSIGHKFVGDTEELIMKNTIKPVETMNPLVNTTVINPVRNNTTTYQTQQQQPVVKKSSHSIATTSKSSPKSFVKKKKTSDPNECIDANSPAAKKIKEKFKSDISGDICVAKKRKL
ncbi:uncharacterized protein LOC116351884 isoform X2 [Contarinia nasturtii]|uniref:uncharacterized protein LOC116351884 isoform X2 n=1 Tax=Contarinia nasturtii TaxID=265458 RepID=UPI0012D4454D|nr:uncharacterized protein LOC116351884 isoform X2 [Contarinia nasturtii]